MLLIFQKLTGAPSYFSPFLSKHSLLLTKGLKAHLVQNISQLSIIHLLAPKIGAQTDLCQSETQDNTIRRLHINYNSSR